jgi:hypothetical protein
VTHWALFWKCVCIIGFGSFVLTVLFIVPLGARDVLRLFRALSGQRDAEDTPRQT